MEELKFSVDNDGIGISIIEDLGTLRKRRIIQYMNTKDEAIRQELIKMGWTPPQEKENAAYVPLDDLRKVLAVLRKNVYEPTKTEAQEEEFYQLITDPSAVKGAKVKFRKYAPLFASAKEEETPPSFKAIHESFRTLTHAVHANAVEHGWWEEDRGTEPLLLMHTEISEAVEALRAGNPESKKIPGHSHVAEELADAVIRVLDYCGKHNINIGAAITAKHDYNRSRPYRHGGKAF